MRKLFLTLGAIVLVAIAGALYFISYRLDGVVESRIERAATLALGTAVQVAGVHTNLRDGTLNISEISVANPPGYQNPYAVRLNEVNAAVDYSAREIKHVVVENPEFFIEEKNGNTNFEQMLQAVDSGIAEETGMPADTGETGSKTQGNEPVIVIKHFRINATRAVFESRSLDRYSDVKVDAIEMNDLRGTPSELAALIGRKVVAELKSEAATELLKAQAKKQLKGARGKASEILRDLMGDDKQQDSDKSTDEDSGEAADPGADPDSANAVPDSYEGA